MIHFDNWEKLQNTRVIHFEILKSPWIIITKNNHSTWCPWLFHTEFRQSLLFIWVTTCPPSNVSWFFITWILFFIYKFIYLYIYIFIYIYTPPSTAKRPQHLPIPQPTVANGENPGLLVQVSRLLEVFPETCQVEQLVPWSRLVWWHVDMKFMVAAPISPR